MFIRALKKSWEQKLLSLIEKKITQSFLDFVEHTGLPWLMGGSKWLVPGMRRCPMHPSSCFLSEEKQSDECTAQPFLSLLFNKVRAVTTLGFITWLQFFCAELSSLSSTSLLWLRYEGCDWNHSSRNNGLRKRNC